mmetsp:Transcript_19147/g.44589  ORF Transcript_19147/g.44589 Transcript_19147/m.44589 type:complete len:2095 (-) Transcript_19147:127-6411(-)
MSSDSDDGEQEEAIALMEDSDDQADADEDADSSEDSVSSGDGEEHTIGDIHTIKAPLGKAIVDFEFPKTPDASDPLQVKYTMSRLPGPPGVQWKDCHAGCYGIAPYWASLYQWLSATEKVPDAKLSTISDSDDELPSDSDLDSDVEAARRKVKKQKTQEEIAEEEAKKQYNLLPLTEQIPAFGIPTTDTIGGLLEANSLAGDAQPIIQAAKGGDVILLNVLIRVASVPLDQIKDALGLTPLHYAAAFGHVSCMKTLATSPEFLAVRASIDNRRFGGNPADYLFTCHPDLYENKNVQALMIPPMHLWEEESWQPRSLFHDAVRQHAEAPQFFDFLVEVFSDGSTIRLDRLNQKDGSGRTTLELATKVARESVAKIFELGGELPNADAWLHLRQQGDLERIIQSMEKGSPNAVSRIYFDACSFSEDTLYSLKECMQRRSKTKYPIVAVDFRECALSTGGDPSDFLEKALYAGFQQLRYLDLTGHKIGSAGLEFFGVLSGEQMLETLILRNCGIQGGVEHLFDDSDSKYYGPLSRLKLLDLTANNMGQAAGNALIHGLMRRYEHQVRGELFVRVFGNRNLRPEVFKASVEAGASASQVASTSELAEYLKKSFDVLAGEAWLEAVAENPPSQTTPSTRSRSRGGAKKRVAESEGEDADVEATPVCSFLKVCPSEDAGMKVPLLRDTDTPTSEFSVPGARPGGPREMRFKATKRKMPLHLKENLARADNIPAPPTGSFVKPDDPETGMNPSWSADKKTMFKFIGTSLHKTRYKWSSDAFHRDTDLVELARIAQKKNSDMKYAMQATRNGSCPGDETPIVPRMYTLPKGKELSQEEAEAKAKARKEEADSDDDSDVFDDDVSDRSYGFGTNQLTPDEEIEILDKFNMNIIPWEKTDASTLHIQDEDATVFGGDGKPLTESLWEAVSLTALRDDEAKLEADRQKFEDMEARAQGQRSQGLGSSAAAPVKKKAKRVELPNNVVDLNSCSLSEAKRENDSPSLMASMQRSRWFWLFVHFMIVFAASSFVVLWPVVTEFFLDRLIKNHFGGFVHTEVEAAEALFWRGPLPSEDWCIAALSLGFASSLLSASLMQLGFLVWRRLDGLQAQGRWTLISVFRVPVMLATALAIVSTPLCPVTVASVQFLLCHSGYPVANVSGASTCSELAHWTVAKSFKFFRSSEYDPWPPAETDEDMLRAAIAATLFSLMATYASIIHRVSLGHFTYEHLESSLDGATVVIEGATGDIGVVNGRYKQVMGQLFQGRPLFSRKLGAVTRFIRQGNPKHVAEKTGLWYVTEASPFRTEVDVSHLIHPWIGLDKGCKYDAVSVEREKPQGAEEDDYDRFVGLYRRGFSTGSSTRNSYFTKQGRDADPAYILPEENTVGRTWNKFRVKLNTIAQMRDMATELAEIGKALQVGESFSSGSAASSSRSAGQEKKKPSRGMEPDIITKEAVEVTYRACTEDWLASLKDISVNAEHLGKLVQTIYEQLTSTSTKDTAAIDAALKAVHDGLEGKGGNVVNTIRGRRGDNAFQFLAHGICLLLGELAGADPEKPGGLYTWKLTDVIDEDGGDGAVVLRQVAGTGRNTAQGLTNTVWEVNVFGHNVDKAEHQQHQAWWTAPNLKATHTAMSSWAPVPGRVLYNFNSTFGLQVVGRTCSVLLDVMFDVLVISGFVMHGYPYFATISITLVLAPAVACWAFLWAHGMMEAWELILCLSQTEVAIEAFRTLRTGKVGQNLIWVAVAEACLESLSQTLFQTYCLLLHFKASAPEKEDHGRLLAESDDGGKSSSNGSMVLVCSVMWGMVNVALVISSLDFHGTIVPSIRSSLFRMMMRYCEVASRVSSIALFAVYFRPEGGQHANTQRAVFILLAIDYLIMVALLTWWDKGGKWLNMFWAMMACLVAPPCFMENFRSFQPVYYTTRAVELTAMILAGVLSRKGPEKLTKNPEARMFIGIFFVSTSIFTLCSLIGLGMQLPAYLRRYTSKRIRAVRIWRPDPEYSSSGVINVYKSDNAATPPELWKEATKRVSVLRGMELEFDDGSVKVIRDPKKRRKNDRCLQLQLQRGEEIVEVNRYHWQEDETTRAGFTLATNYGRRWGTWQSAAEEEEE